MRNAEALFPSAERQTYDAYRYSPMVLAGSTLYISGIIGHEKGCVPEDPAAEYHAAFRQLEERLRAAGGTLADVVVIDSYHVSNNLSGDVGTFIEVRAKYISNPPFPAWTAIGVASLGIPGARLELRVTAELEHRAFNRSHIRQP